MSPSRPGAPGPGGARANAPRIGISGVLRRWQEADRAGVNAAYVRAVVGAGGVPLILSQLMAPGDVGLALDACDGLVLTGGEDIDPSYYGEAPSSKLGAVDRERDRFELALFAAARERGLPVLGICRGIQLINVALGGTLYQDLPSERPGAIDHDPKSARTARTHQVRLAPGSRAARVLGVERLVPNSFHHQAIKQLAPGLVATGWTDDGLIEAVESADGPWLLAVQWHPEEMHADATAPELKLFGAVVDAARRPGSGAPARSAAAGRRTGAQ
ncbi:MAG TPA: gamma-glutamyl-gamma-aminobutyrate hydrolase family protein [Gemmatimonadales bacterium]|nr:gamma-glutamyl-gamma-aminobutyrate hydrolase family protein [Gemmatimonadales bacterium]